MIAALASFLDARANNGRWLLRIEDLDPPRESPEATRQILLALEKLNLHWDQEVLFQSQRHAAYETALQSLIDTDMVFPCTCTRQEIQENEGVYPGNCRHLSLQNLPAENTDYAVRCKVQDRVIEFFDLLQGWQKQNLEQELGDFIIKRKDGLFAYQLAVVLDDAFQAVTHVIRGTDLLSSTQRQIYLQSLLLLPQPVYAHIPIIVNKEGQKLSKQHHAATLDLGKPTYILYQGLKYLQQDPPAYLLDGSPSEVLDWAIRHWNISRLKNMTKLDEDQKIVSF